jgi:hypothetical protein
MLKRRVRTFFDITHIFTDKTLGFYNTLSKSQARGAVWRVVGQQIVFTQLNEGGTCEYIPFLSP